MQRHLSQRQRRLLPLAALFCVAVLSTVLSEYGAFRPWYQLPPPPAPITTFSSSFFDAVVVTRADGTAYLWRDFKSGRPLATASWILVTPAMNLNRPDFVTGQRPCASFQIAMLSSTRPQTPYHDCVSNRQYHADGSTDFIYVIDAAGSVWVWSQSHGPGQLPLVTQLLLLGMFFVMMLTLSLVLERIMTRRAARFSHHRGARAVVRPILPANTACSRLAGIGAIFRVRMR